jgi:hypothetical protein
MQTPTRGYSRDQAPQCWEEALLCGNGTLGAILMGQPQTERVIFTHEKLFLPLHEKRSPVVTREHLPHMREMLAAGKFKEVAELVADLGREQGYPGMLWTDSFFPACELALDLAAVGPVTEYTQALDFATGLAAVEWQDGRGRVSWRGFVSRADGAAVLQLNSLDNTPISCTLELRHVDPREAAGAWGGPEKYRHHLAVPEVAVEENWLYFGGRFRTADHGYDCLARVISTGGRQRVEGRLLHIVGASQLLLLVQVLPASAVARAQREEMRGRLASLPPNFDALFARHVEIHATLYGRTTIRLGSVKPSTEDAAGEITPAWEEACQGRPSPAFFAKLFDAGRYEILSSCGEWPPNLQGVWAGAYGVPWSSDYTINGNAQTAVAALLASNLPECMDSFLRYIEFLVPDMRWNAEALYGCSGILLSSRSSSHGANNHFSVGHPHTLWTAGAGWAAHFFYDYWLYTGDDEFFRERALPFMKEVALFYEDFLVEDENGYWLFSPSYSPENTPSNSDNSACTNATMDIAIARELYNNLLEGCRTLRLEQGNLAQWERMLGKMPPYMINRDGAVKEWCDPRLEEQYDHRHASHLYPLMYGIARELEQDEALLAAFAQAYKLRIARRDREAGIMAFGSVQMAQAAVHLRDAETVWSLLQELAAGYYYPNLATSHDRGPHIFNADLSGGLPAVMLECLVQSRQVQDAQGRIEGYRLDILPVLPLAWQYGMVTGVSARGGFTVDLAWEGGQLISLTIHNEKGKPCSVYYRDQELQVSPVEGRFEYTAHGRRAMLFSPK